MPKNSKKDSSGDVFDSFLENLKIQPKKKPAPKPISRIMPSPESTTPSPIENKVEVSAMSDELKKTMRMLEDIKQEELAADAAETLKEDIPTEIDESLLKRITCPFCNRSIPLRKFEFLSQGYSDTCPQCGSMILPDHVADQL